MKAILHQSWVRYGVNLVILVVIWALVPTTRAQGVIVPWVETDPQWLKIDYHRVDVRIANQIAETEVALQFTNTGDGLAEGTFLFPLPQGATVQELIMTIDGMAIEARILRADEARGIYDEIVRQYRDPALLEYVGQDLIQANVFPIPSGESREVRITYEQLLTVDNGLFKYVYPLHTGSSVREVAEMQIRVVVESDISISNVYSPSHSLRVVRPDDFSFSAGFEASAYQAEGDFTLYYGVSEAEIGVNLLSYRESAGEDGFFVLMVQPPLMLNEAQVQPKDVVLVIDQSGSMFGDKWEQAREAALYVLDNLNARDRFNVIAFSTGWRVYGRTLLPASEADDAKAWLRGLDADGGTDIHGALSTALTLADVERPLTILFLTDGLATEGITDTGALLASLGENAPENARIFTFGVGYDVDTFLLDRLVRDFGGTGTYVRPNERIDEAVEALYNKISAPVMTDIRLTWDGIMPELVYPRTLPDLFVGEQLTVVGRYRDSASRIEVDLSGVIDGEVRTLRYSFDGFSERAGGEDFLARLWATRRIGDLLNTIRLNGENPELVESVVSLSIRYGIITPYTSFLIEEDDILSQQGRASALESFAEEAEVLADDFTGARAVDAADTTMNLSQAVAPAPMPTSVSSARGQSGGAVPQSAPMGGVSDADADADDEQLSVNVIRYVGDKTFILQDGIWTDTVYEPDVMEVIEVVFLSDAYFDLLERYADVGAYLALGERVIVVIEGLAYRVEGS